MQWNFTIPKTTPPGLYLLRFEHIFLSPVDTQYYANCAHVKITNKAGSIGTPGPRVKIPGVYAIGQPGKCDPGLIEYDPVTDANLRTVLRGPRVGQHGFQCL
jgi:hypothetical protein